MLRKKKPDQQTVDESRNFVEGVIYFTLLEGDTKSPVPPDVLYIYPPHPDYAQPRTTPSSSDASNDE